METIYQFSDVLDPKEYDWQDCSERAYYDLEGYDIPRRIITREPKSDDWLKLWEDFTFTPEYRQALKEMKFRAFYDWLKDNFNIPSRK